MNEHQSEEAKRTMETKIKKVKLFRNILYGNNKQKYVMI